MCIVLASFRVSSNKQADRGLAIAGQRPPVKDLLISKTFDMPPTNITLAQAER
ncbi:unnamed protein product, partial [marine sediment metagenome]